MSPSVAHLTKAQCVVIAKRRADAIDLKLAGVDWLTISRKLAADPAINSDRVAYPQGYGFDRYIIAAWLRTFTEDSAGSIASTLRQHPTCAQHFRHLVDDVQVDHRIRAGLTQLGDVRTATSKADAVVCPQPGCGDSRLDLITAVLATS
jgi:hypothetical protein